ncbi:hypothetical protein DLJ74_05040 [Gracilibacillus dipsosauri]|uniref:Uncharacterized protein n=1 Tax=Gracilibacillus dipsosauri TaxID=178340 RepID=A0A317L0K8_9BACI|nr:hypothetical protein DLJ74_05040 [Gracilibacillus dipsosauri]
MAFIAWINVILGRQFAHSDVYSLDKRHFDLAFAHSGVAWINVILGRQFAHSDVYSLDKRHFDLAFAHSGVYCLDKRHFRPAVCSFWRL